MLKTCYETLPKHYQELLKDRLMHRLVWSNTTFYRRILSGENFTPSEEEIAMHTMVNFLKEAIGHMETKLNDLEQVINKQFKRLTP